jgi:folate-dependent phosphoribosylglycinamide formyltransferase PurN
MSQKTKSLLVYASGSSNGGGSGFRKMCEANRSGLLNILICGVLTNHPNGGVAQIASEYGIQVFVVPDDLDMRDSESTAVINFYADVETETNPNFIMLSGWVFKIPAEFCGEHIFNIHPAPMIEGIDKGKCGLDVHQSVLDSNLTSTAVNIHSVGIEYDDPKNKIFTIEIPIPPEIENAKELQGYVGKIEHMVQSEVLNAIIHGLAHPTFVLPKYSSE